MWKTLFLFTLFFFVAFGTDKHLIRLCQFGGGLDLWSGLANITLPGQTESFNEQNGVSFQITTVFGSIQQFGDLQAGVCDMCGTFTDNAAYRYFNFSLLYDVIACTDQGANSGLVVNTNTAPITNPSNPMTAIQGKSILVDGPLSGLVLLMYSLSAQAGLTPFVDYQLVVAGATNFRIEYVSNGVLPPNLGGGPAYATMSNDPTTAQFLGMNSALTNIPALSSLPGPYQATCWIANQTYSRDAKNAPAIRAFLKSMVQAMRFALDPNNYEFMINYLMTTSGYTLEFATSYFCEFVLQPTGWNRDLQPNLEGLCTIGTERASLSTKFPAILFAAPPKKTWIKDFVNLDHLNSVLKDLDHHHKDQKFQCSCC